MISHLRGGSAQGRSDHGYEFGAYCHYRRRLHDQAVTAATLLGIAPPAPWIEELPVKSGPRPHLVLRNAASSAILAAAAGGTGLLLVDDRAMPSMSSVGSNFDKDTDRLLNALSLGLDVSVEDPVSGRTSMRCPPAGVIGVLAEPEWSSLYKATGRQLLATIFVAAAPPPIVSDASNLASLLHKVGIMAVTPIRRVGLRRRLRSLSTAPGAPAGTGLGGGPLTDGPRSLSTGHGPVHTGRPAVAPISVRTHSAGPRIVGTFPRRTAGSGTIPKYGRLKTSVTSQSASTESISWRPRTSNDDE